VYTALAATTQTLVAFLRERLESAPDVTAVLGTTVLVTAATPQELGEEGRSGLSVWLYRVARDEDVLNAPPERLDASTERRTPLPLRLHYLITPIADADVAVGPDTEQRMLGRVLQAFYDTPRFTGPLLGGSFAGTRVELCARLEPMSLEEITRVWDALDATYQLSVSYEVTVVRIRSERIDSRTPVETVIPEVGIVVPADGGP
jgi:hypothetical protein